MSLPEDYTVALHAARLLVLIAETGSKQSGSADSLPAIKGRTLLAKLDFFLRYPKYLAEAAEIRQVEVNLAGLGIRSEEELDSVESRMVRYKYGPWDHIYYVTLAYLVGKGLLTVRMSGRTELFCLTEDAKIVLASLEQNESFLPLFQRARLIRRVFGKYSGNKLKDFIYEHFPSVVGRKIGAQI